MSKKFIRNIEDFICENCKTQVSGNGYTNHCPNCLYSKDVDINPGDRLCKCHGLMKPIEITLCKDSYIILHKCIRCGKERKNKSSEYDNFDSILQVMKNKK